LPSGQGFSAHFSDSCAVRSMAAIRRTENTQMSSKEAKTLHRSNKPVKAKAAPKVGKLKRRQGLAVSIRDRNQANILKAAEAVFAEKGFEGATTAEIATRAGVPKPNIHYYFGTKQQLYDRLIANILEVWLDAMDVIRDDADPATAIGAYISRKIRASKEWPDSSRVWATEIIGGGRNVSAFLRGRLRRVVREKGMVLAKWAEEGRMDKVDPAHFFFMIWAATQTYADFGTQVAAVLAKDRLDGKVFVRAEETIKAIVLKGCGVSTINTQAGS
jgi:TetR/AcrR family transcriptional regulator